jgi:hypothetical protein
LSAFAVSSFHFNSQSFLDLRVESATGRRDEQDERDDHETSVKASGSTNEFKLILSMKDLYGVGSLGRTGSDDEADS